MFAVGQNVVCVDVRGLDGALRRGAIYRIARVRDKFLELDGYPGPHAGFYRFRFRPAPDISTLRALLKQQPAAVSA